MEIQIKHLTKLTETDQKILRDFVSQAEKERKYPFKIDAESYTSDKVEHIFLFKDGALFASAMLSCYEEEAIEVTAIVPEIDTIFAQLHTEVKRIVGDKGTKKVLYIAEERDTFLQQALENVCGDVSFTEYRMALDVDTFARVDDNPLLLRRATLDDCDVLVDLYTSAFGSEGFVMKREYVIGDLAETLMAYDGDKLIGVMKATDEGHKSGIYGVIVIAELRGKGYGRKMLSQSMQDLIAAGKTYIYLEVNSNNPPALSLYKSMGFVAFATFNYFVSKL